MNGMCYKSIYSMLFRIRVGISRVKVCFIKFLNKVACRRIHPNIFTYWLRRGINKIINIILRDTKDININAICV